jgi:hypothetical protein
MEVESLIKKIEKFRNYCHKGGKHRNYEGIWKELGTGIAPFDQDNITGNGIEKNVFYEIHLGPATDADYANGYMEHQIFYFSKDDKIKNICIASFMKNALFLFKPAGELNCHFCNSKSSNTYSIKKMLIFSENISFCSFCQLLIDDEYLQGFDFYGKWEEAEGLGNGIFDIDYEQNGVKYQQNGFPSPLNSDLHSNLSKVKAKIEVKKDEAIKKIEETINGMEKAVQIAKKRAEKVSLSFKEKEKKLEDDIIKLLKEKAVKMPASDIDAFLKYQNIDRIKAYCEDMYIEGKINRTSNYRYFILEEESKQPKKSSASKSEEVDVKSELKKYKEMLDEGIITQEEYDAKRKQILGL